MDLHISLSAIALAAIINLWLAIRCGKVRGDNKIAHGDGGSPLLMRRMRAHANFVEYTPFALLLILVLDLSGKQGWPLALISMLFLLGRVLHGMGMDSESVPWTRKAGIILTLPILLGLAIWAILIAFKIA